MSSDKEDSPSIIAEPSTNSNVIVELTPEELEEKEAKRLEKLAAKKARKAQKKENFNKHRKEKREEAHLRKQAAKKAALDEHLAQFTTEEEKEAELVRLTDERIAKHNELLQFDEDCFEGKGLRIAINCGFSHIMEDKELTSLGKQLMYARNFVRNERIPVQMNMTSWPQEADHPFLVRATRLGLPNWRVPFHAENYWEVFGKDNVVVLSPDAEEDLEDELDPTKVYVIGGIVDRTVAKGETASQAALHGVQMRRLPFKKHIGTVKSFVLNVNTVVEILALLHRDKDMATALKQAIPQRKQDNIIRNARDRGEEVIVNAAKSTEAVDNDKDEPSASEEERESDDNSGEQENNATHSINEVEGEGDRDEKQEEETLHQGDEALSKIAQETAEDEVEMSLLRRILYCCF